MLGAGVLTGSGGWCLRLASTGSWLVLGARVLTGSGGWCLRLASTGSQLVPEPGC